MLAKFGNLTSVVEDIVTFRSPAKVRKRSGFDGVCDSYFPLSRPLQCLT